MFNCGCVPGRGFLVTDEVLQVAIFPILGNWIEIRLEVTIDSGYKIVMLCFHWPEITRESNELFTSPPRWRTL